MVTLQSSTVEEATEFIVDSVPFWIPLLISGGIISIITLQYIIDIVDISS